MPCGDSEIAAVGPWLHPLIEDSSRVSLTGSFTGKQRFRGGCDQRAEHALEGIFCYFGLIPSLINICTGQVMK